MFSGFYSAAEFEKYMRYIDGPRKRQFGAAEQVATPRGAPQKEPGPRALLRKRKLRQVKTKV